MNHHLRIRVEKRERERENDLDKKFMMSENHSFQILIHIKKVSVIKVHVQRSVMMKMMMMSWWYLWKSCDDDDDDWMTWWFFTDSSSSSFDTNSCFNWLNSCVFLLLHSFHSFISCQKAVINILIIIRMMMKMMMRRRMIHITWHPFFFIFGHVLIEFDMFQVISCHPLDRVSSIRELL